MIRSILYIIMLAVLGGLVACASVYHADKTPSDATYYLVRHAEKVLDVSDPGLTEAGQKRAQDLAVRLKDVSLTAIYSSDYKRTRQTAQPVAAAKDIIPNLYDPRDLDGFAQTMRQNGGTVLIVGHSNTTPNLSALLGGESGREINEADEYDRLYIVTTKDDVTQTLITTYGD